MTSAVLTSPLLVFSLLINEVVCDCCTSGFPSLEYLTSLNETDVETLEQSPLQGIFPTLRFTCEGNLTQIIYRTGPSGSEFGRSELLEFWRRGTTNSNVSMAFTLIQTREDEFLFRNISPSASLYATEVNVPVKAGDFLGIGQLVRSTMRFFDVTNRSEPAYYYRSLLMSSYNFEGKVPSPYLPLLTAVISPSSAVCMEPTSFMQAPIMTSSPVPTVTTTAAIQTTALPHTDQRRKIAVGAGISVGIVVFASAIIAVVIGMLAKKKRAVKHKQFSSQDNLINNNPIQVMETSHVTSNAGAYLEDNATSVINESALGGKGECLEGTQNHSLLDCSSGKDNAMADDQSTQGNEPERAAS